MSDSDDPAAALSPPRVPEVDFVPGLVEKFPDLVSPSYWLSEALGATIKTNPLEWVKEKFGGDWKGVYECGVALQNTGKCVSLISQDITTATQEMFVKGSYKQTGPPATPNGDPLSGRAWHGKAAASAQHYFNNLSSYTATDAASLTALGTQYVALAHQYKASGDAIAAGMTVILDTLLVLAVNIAAEVATAETVIGPVIGAAGIVLEIAELVHKWEEILGEFGKLDALAKNLAAVLSNEQALAKVLNFPLPGAAYDNTSVA